MEQGNLETNINAMEAAADAVRNQRDFDAIPRFYHLTLLECAERMNVEDFAQCVQIAREQLRRNA